MTSLSTKLKCDMALVEQELPELGEPNRPVRPSRYLAGDNLAERLFAACLLVPGIPLIGFLCLVIRATSRGPAIFRQRRVGRHGVEYTMYKLRTMRGDAETGTGPVWSVNGDPRLTRIGRLLRRVHLDELPQLINVVKGEMSLVGPRPERPEFVEVLEDVVPGYCERLRVRPGITGLAQVNLPPDSGTLSVRRKVRLDVEYIRTAGRLLDFQILVCTALKVFFIPAGWRIWLTGVDRSQCLADIRADESDVALTPEELARPRQHNGRRRVPGGRRPSTPK